jgi:hypothetical protein
MKLQFAGPWARGRLPATTVPGYALTAFSLRISSHAASFGADRPGHVLGFTCKAATSNQQRRALERVLIDQFQQKKNYWKNFERSGVICSAVSSWDWQQK